MKCIRIQVFRDIATKVLILLLTIAITGCYSSKETFADKKEKIKLTPENIEDYLTFDLDSSESTIKYVGNKTVGGYVGNFEGEMTKKYFFMKQKDLSFEDVKIEIEYSVCTYDNGHYYVQFKNGSNKKGVKTTDSGNEYPKYTHTSIVSIPFDGSKVIDTVTMEVIALEDLQTLVDMSDRQPEMIYDLEIVNVTGFVIKNS